MEPINRREVFLNALCADKSCGLEPVSREEILLKRLVEAEANEGGGSGIPFGEETEVILPVQDVPKLGDAYGVAERCHLVAGETYTVTFEGVEYICAAKTFDMDGVATVILGNTYFLSDGAEDATEEPFVYMSVPDEAVEMVGACGMVLEDDGRSESVQFGIAKNTITKISGKYVEGMGYVEGGLETVFPKQTISNYKKHELGGYFAIVENVGAVIEAGKTYRVTVDDTVFESVAQAEGENQVYVGNYDMRIGFVYMADDDCLHINTDDNTPRQICIEVDNEVIHPIDKKYLPSGGGVFWVTCSADDSRSISLNKTFGEIEEAIKAGLHVKATLEVDGIREDFEVYGCEYGFLITFLSFSKSAGKFFISSIQIWDDGTTEYKGYQMTVTAL